MKLIQLRGKRGEGKFAIVDDDFYEIAKDYSYHVTERGYAVNCSRGHLLMHQEVLGGRKEGFMIDHINGEKLDNRKANLRYCTEKENLMNRRKYAKNKTGYKGVRKKRDKFIANIGYNGKYLYLGQFDTAREAAKRYNHFAKHLHGEFASLNDV